MSDIKNRLLSFIEYKSLSVRAFEQMAHLSNGAVNKVGFSTRSKTIDKISTAFPELNISWLRTGQGNMLVSGEQPIHETIKSDDIKYDNFSGALVYDIDATCGTEGREMIFANDTVIGSVDLPFINKTSQIIRASGDSMEPKVHNGDLIVIRQIHDFEDIFYGQIYLIILDEYRMIKYIRRYEQDEKNYIILRSENEKYDDITLHKSKIRKLFVVENILSITNQI